MEKPVAAKIDVMMAGALLHLTGLADYIRENVPTEQRRKFLRKVADVMAEIIEVSKMIHEEHPELNPYLEEQRAAAMLQRIPGLLHHHPT